MIHFFPELATLYHRSLLLSHSISSKEKMWKEWTQVLWKFSTDKANFHTHDPTPNGQRIGGYLSAHLGKRNKDSQKLISYCSSLEEIQNNDALFECADSLLIEIDPQNLAQTEIFKWQAGPVWSGTKILWCLRSPFSTTPSLHEKALDKKMAELAPDSQRILWPNDHFVRDGLEWVLSF